MTNTPDRPSLARKQTRKSAERADEAMDAGVSITLDGRAHTVRIGDVTAREAGRFRREVGATLASVMDDLAENPDIDYVAALVWLSRVMDGDDVTFDEVAAEFGYEEMARVEIAAATAEDTDVDYPEG